MSEFNYLEEHRAMMKTGKIVRGETKMRLSDKILSETIGDWIEVKDLKQTIQDFTKELKGKLWAEEKHMAPKIKGHDWANGYSSACHDFRTEIIDKLNQKHYGEKLLEGGRAKDE